MCPTFADGNQLPEQIERTLVRLKREKPYWGAPKIRELLIRRFPNLRPPAVSTVHAVLDRIGLVNCRKRRRFRAEGTALSTSQNPNDLWSADFKGEFMLGDKRYCYPLTLSDHASRYLLAIEVEFPLGSGLPSLLVFLGGLLVFGLVRGLRPHAPPGAGPVAAQAAFGDEEAVS